ncbi:MAG: cupin domain-containing protein [Bacteroidales bacterium]|nr:cupin domain-containing protein [Bacteroidales bacterium]
MIIDFDKIDVSVLPHFKGGEKEMTAHMFFDGTNKIMRGRLVPGATIGLHTHEGNCEVIFITRGHGSALYDGERHPVQCGQCHYCPQGHSHSLINDSDADLEFVAVVAKQ